MRISWIGLLLFGICTANARAEWNDSRQDQKCASILKQLFRGEIPEPFTFEEHVKFSGLPEEQVAAEYKKYLAEHRKTYVESTEEWWKFFGQMVSSQANKNIRKIRETYIEAKLNGDEHVRNLERLGYRFGKQVETPSLENLVARYRSEIQKHVRSGRISSSDILMPALVFRLPDGKYQSVAIGDPIPKGAQWVYTVLPGPVFSKAIRSGHFPMGGSTESNSNYSLNLSLFEHDTAHLTSFLENPEYMKAIRQAASRSRKGQPLLSEEEKQAHEMRWYYASESLSLPRPERRDEILRILSLPPPSPGVLLKNSSFTVNEVKDHLLKTKTEAQIKNLSEEIKKKFLRFRKQYGGAGNDLRNAHEEHDILLGHFNKLRTASNPMEQAEALAKVEVALVELGRVTPAEWVLEVTKPTKLTLGTKLYNIVCLSGIWTRADRLFQVHCP